MKYCFLIILLFLLLGCTKIEHVEFTGVAPGIDNGVFTISTLDDQDIYGVNISGRKFYLAKTFDHSGYYNIVLSKGKETAVYEVYLEDGKYNVAVNREDFTKYPVITSSSKIQNELSAYHHLVDEANTAKMNTLTDTAKAVRREPQSPVAILEEFTEKNPGNSIALHIMLAMNYQDDPVVFYKIYSKLNDAEKNSNEGKELGAALGHLVKLAKGSPAPPLAGTTPDGKSVDIKAMHKKLILVEFWKAGAGEARVHHEAMLKNPLFIDNKDLGIISVSLDNKRDWWDTSVKDDKMTWTQVSDLEGDESPNVDNWGIQNVPTYYLLDGSGHILQRDIPFMGIAFAVTTYLKTH